ncbi:ABC transporter ATP-binding protein [Couchioplanes caeruleus]|uniref:ABC transporter n=2 Tax=Couchioplanes caeruleus TaxID=56438 RepID=A0A1K0GX11_9ACTN|nr:ABC transporter ATP-binding protein [Couchioplanes caeruleus]OJF15940.1 ABC transporter [Couchioplanes caeruleus subsp. caeruleus]ROP28529.1 ATP-binding cassette subfamily B protein [Couchioplanes caeruleus]
MNAGPATLRLLARTARRTPGWGALLVASSAANSVAILALPAALAAATDAVLGRGGTATAATRLGLVIATSALCTVLATVAEAGCLSGGTRWLRHEVLRVVVARGTAARRKVDPGDVTSRLVSAGSDAGHALDSTVDVIVGAATSIGGIVALWLIDWRCAVAFLVAAPVSWAVLGRFVADTSATVTRYRTAQAAIVSLLQDALAGIRTVQAAGTVRREIDRVLAPLDGVSAAGHATWAAQRRMAWQGSILSATVNLAVLGAAGWGVSAGRLSAGQFVAAAGYVALALGLIAQVEAFTGLGYARAGARRLAELLAEPVPAAGDCALREGPGAVSFRGVTVRRKERAVLDRLDLDVPAGCAVAVVGRSGAGKTTLAGLVGGLVRADEGVVLLDGVPVTAFAAGAVAYAFERPVLLGRTVHDAISYGSPGLDRSAVRAAAAAAQADAFIRLLPDGYDTPLPEAPMSGGEVQRIGLARALARDARVLVLDDATSGLDTVTEARIGAVLTDRLAGRTRIVVTHRPATAARADLVAWLDAGRLRAVGRHRDLWARPDYRAVFAAGDADGTPP